VSDEIESTLAEVVGFFEGRFAEHGAVPQGVDYNSVAAQVTRFQQLEKILEGHAGRFSLLDYGCGYGALAHYLRERGHAFDYVGYDLSSRLVEAARETPGADPAWRFTSELEDVEPCDFAIACGVFNVKLEASEAEWEAYVFQQLDTLRQRSRLGFAFNTLTSYSDADRMRDDLYYPDPKRVFDHCVRSHSRHVALLHDYPLYDCTFLVRLR